MNKGSWLYSKSKSSSSSKVETVAVHGSRKRTNSRIVDGQVGQPHVTRREGQLFQASVVLVLPGEPFVHPRLSKREGFSQSGLEHRAAMRLHPRACFCHTDSHCYAETQTLMNKAEANHRDDLAVLSFMA